MRFILALVCVLAVASATEYKTYDGYKVYQIVPKNPGQLGVLKTLREDQQHGNIDFWSTPRFTGYPVDVMVAPNYQAIFTTLLRFHNMEFSVKHENVKRLIDMERIAQKLAPKQEGRISFTQYNSYADIVNYLNQLASAYPNIVTVDSAGSTVNGNDIARIKISSGGSGKPVILVDSGIHAREWIAPAMGLYIINQLVENPANAAMYANVDWIIIPVLNPDGYQYTFSNERFWRKNRNPSGVCVGVDNNRNFDFHWMETGASSNPCDETYAGPSGGSEKETQALVATVESNSNIVLYLTFHSYGQYLLYPWGWTSALPDDWQNLDALAQDVNDAIAAVAGTEYEIGSSTNVLYSAAGGSDDWVKGVGGTAYSYTLELPGGGLAGFDLPPSRIIPVVEETWEGMEVYWQFVEDNYARK